MKAAPAQGIIIAGMHGSSGKTAVTCMLLAALAERGIPIQPFKAGPDFIDPGYHAQFAGVPSRNLDTWLMGNSGVLQEAAAHAAAKIGIVEGVMGLFDGSDVRSDEGSTMELARLLGWPVLLVVPAVKAGRSLAASLRGFIAEAGEGRIAGFVLNGVNGESHAEYLREAIAPLRLPVLGAVPHCEELAWPERHLGLQASQERELPGRGELAKLAAQYLDVTAILELASGVEISSENGLASRSASARGEVAFCSRIGIARDEALHFYYESNLDYLRQAGAQLVEFSPLRDRALPENLDGLLFGGGFPEVFADALSQNQSMRSEIRSAIDAGMPCHAECGGLMFLAAELVTLDGRRYPMAGAIPGAVEMTRGLQHFGYCSCSGLAGADGAEFRGHEFHHSRWLGEAAAANLWTVRRKRSGSSRMEGFSSQGLHASYVHLYFPTSEAAVAPLLNREFQPS